MITHLITKYNIQIAMTLTEREAYNNVCRGK